MMDKEEKDRILDRIRKRSEESEYMARWFPSEGILHLLARDGSFLDEIQNFNSQHAPEFLHFDYCGHTCTIQTRGDDVVLIFCPYNKVNNQIVTDTRDKFYPPLEVLPSFNGDGSVTPFKF